MSATVQVTFDAADPGARLREEADRLVAVGGTKLYELEERGQFWITMQDPEGNEFCLD